MTWKSYSYIAVLAALIVGTFYFSYTGAALPGPDDGTKVSLRNVQNRRSHFVRYYSFGK